MSRTENPIIPLLRQIDRQETLIKTLRRRTTELSRKLGLILSNQTHYMRFRAPKVAERQKALAEQAKRFVKRMEKLPNLKLHTSYNARNSKANRVIFFCTGNEARKLRAMLNIDFRQFNHRGLRNRKGCLYYNRSKRK